MNFIYFHFILRFGSALTLSALEIVKVTIGSSLLVAFFGYIGLDFSLLPLSLLNGKYSLAWLKFPLEGNPIAETDFLRVASLSSYILFTKG
jgi:hypothetical protein